VIQDYCNLDISLLFFLSYVSEENPRPKYANTVVTCLTSIELVLVIISLCVPPTPNVIVTKQFLGSIILPMVFVPEFFAILTTKPASFGEMPNGYWASSKCPQNHRLNCYNAEF
jgi:hypothetical protein